MVVLCKRTAGLFIGMCSLMGLVSPVGAQTVTIYSMAALVDSARHHLPVLLEKQALIQSAEAGITQAKHAFLPKLNVVEELSIGTANDLTGGFMPAPGVFHAISGGVTAANNYEAATGNLASLYGEYELVNFGLRGAQLASAKANAGLQQADFDQELYLVKWQIGKLYFEILRNASQLAVDEENIRRYQSMYTISSALTGSGVNPGVDSSLAKAGLSSTRVSYNQELANLRKLRQQLSYLTGISAPQIAMDTAEKRPEVSAAGFLGSVGGGAAGGNAGTERGAGDARSKGSVGGGGNPLADYYLRRQQQYRSEEDLIRKMYLPKIVLGAGGWARGSSIQYSNDYKPLEEGLGYQRLNYMAGVGISYDLFNGVRKKDRLAVAAYQADAAGYALQQQQLSLQNEALQADEDIQAAKKNLAELPVQLQAASDAYGQKLAQYRAGIINLVDLTNASFVLYEAQSDYITTLNAWYMASLNKAAVTGNLDLFIQTVK
jgi:outer membrane protein TolC